MTLRFSNLFNLGEMNFIKKIIAPFTKNTHIQWYVAGGCGIVLLVINYPFENAIPRYAGF